MGTVILAGGRLWWRGHGLGAGSSCRLQSRRLRCKKHFLLRDPFGNLVMAARFPTPYHPAQAPPPPAATNSTSHTRPQPPSYLSSSSLLKPTACLFSAKVMVKLENLTSNSRNRRCSFVSVRMGRSWTMELNAEVFRCGGRLLLGRGELGNTGAHK